MYYCNRQDPALFIQNRCGPGYTLNFGNMYAWPIALLVIGDFVFLATAAWSFVKAVRALRANFPGMNGGAVHDWGTQRLVIRD